MYVDYDSSSVVSCRGMQPRAYSEFRSCGDSPAVSPRRNRTHHTYYMPHPSHSSRLDHSNHTEWGVQIIKLHICSFLHSPVTSCLLGPVILLSTLFSRSEPNIHSWLHPTTTDHTGRTSIHIHPLYRYCLSTFWGNYDPLMMAMTCWNTWGKPRMHQ
jgi:hypothetical protein